MEDFSQFTQNVIEFNSKVWNDKKAKNLSLKDSIEINIPENLQQFKKDLVAMHNLKSD